MTKTNNALRALSHARVRIAYLAVALAFVANWGFSQNEYTITVGVDGSPSTTSMIQTTTASSSTVVSYNFGCYSDSGVYSQTWISNVEIYADGDGTVGYLPNDFYPYYSWTSLIKSESGQRMRGRIVYKYEIHGHTMMIKATCSRNDTGMERSFRGKLNDKGDYLTIVQLTQDIFSFSTSTEGNDISSSGGIFWVGVKNNTQGTYSFYNVSCLRKDDNSDIPVQNNGNILYPEGYLLYTMTIPENTSSSRCTYRLKLPMTYTDDIYFEFYQAPRLSTYTITYKPGANGTGTTQTATKTKDVALTLKGAVFTRTGFTQTGWSTSDGGPKAYDLSASYTANAAATLYPYWTAASTPTYTIFYDYDGGTYDGQHGENETSMSYDKWFDVGSPVKSGYKFVGWTVSSGLDTNTAKWCPWTGTTAKLTSASTLCYSEYGIVSFFNLRSTAGTVTLKANWTYVGKPELAFYEPDIWPAAVFLTSEKGSTSPRTSFTQNEIFYVSFAYKNAGAANAGGHLASVVVTDKDCTTALAGIDCGCSGLSANSTCHRNSVLFAATWEPGTYRLYVYLDSSDDIDESNENNNGRYVEFTVTAAPTPTYTITYRPGSNCTGNPQTATKTKDVALTLLGETFTRTGYTQTGWSTSDGGPKAYSLSASYTANAAATLYPYWTATSVGKPVVSTSGNEECVRLDWDPALNADGYSIWRATSASGTKSRVQTQIITTTSYNTIDGVMTALKHHYAEDTTATPGVDYWYWVEATKGSVSTYSDSVSNYRRVSLSLSKNGLSFVSAGCSDSVSVTANTSWTATKTKDWLTLATSGTSGNGSVGISATANSGTAGRSDTITVKAGGSTSHPVSKTISVTQTGAATPAIPPQPTGVSATQGTYADKVVFTWSASSGAATYRVFRQLASSTSIYYDLIASGMTSCSYTDTAVTPGTHYRYVVAAFNSANERSAYSSPAEGWAAAASSAQNPNLVPYKPKAWPAAIYLARKKNSQNVLTTVTVGETVYLNFAYANFGSEAAASHRVSVVLKNAAGSVIKEWNLKQGRLNVNACRGVTDIGFSVPAAGKYTAFVTLDFVNVLDETNESDNTSQLTFSANAPVSVQTVKFDANGGTGKMAAQTMTYGTAAKLRKNVFARSGYVFIGWAKSKYGAVAFTDAQRVKNLAANGGTVTLYAKWAKKNYKVKFYANAKNAKGKMSAQAMTYGKTKKLSANKFKRKGYVFKGWAKSKADAKKGKVAYKNKKSVKNLTTNGKTVKLYAVWGKK